MIINRIWLLIIILSIIYSFFTANMYIINNTILSSPKHGLNVMLSIFPNIILWSGLLKVALDTGYLKSLSNKMLFITKFLFPEIPENSKIHYYLSANICSNILGLGSASIPMGLKAISLMQELNKDKNTCTNSMITLILLNTSSLTLVPTTILVLRQSMNANVNIELIPQIILATSITTISAILLDRVVRKIRG